MPERLTIWGEDIKNLGKSIKPLEVFLVNEKNPQVFSFKIDFRKNGN